MWSVDLKSGTGVIVISGEWANVKVLMALRDADDSIVRGSQGWIWFLKFSSECWEQERENVTEVADKEENT